jgi:hypothetical protein
MSWLVKTDKLEVWTESEYRTKKMKCEYYGAKPFWKKIRRLDPPTQESEVKYSIGEIIPYSKSAIEKHFLVIVKLFQEAGEPKLEGIDIHTKMKVIAPIAT